MKTYQHSNIVVRGFSLVELLVAMVITLVVMAGVINSFLASKDAYRYNQELAFIQENARFADSKMSSDIRDAGDFGCSLEPPSDWNNFYYANNLVNVLGDTSTLTTPDFYKAIGIQGYNGLTATWPNATVHNAALAVNSTTPPHAIMVRHGDLARAISIQSHDANYTFTLKTGTYNTTAVNNFPAGMIMVYADANCQYQAIFQSTGPAPGAAVNTIAHNINGGAVSQTPGNFTTSLQGNLHPSLTSYYFGNYAGYTSNSECGTATTCLWRIATPIYSADSKVMPMSSNIYFVGKSTIDTSMNSLYVMSLTDNGATGAAQELVLGVDDMRIYYGIDTLDGLSASSGAPDGTANRYVTADAISHDVATSSNAYSYLVWNRVTSVRIQLLMRSRNRLSSNPSQSFTWDDSNTVNTNDGYLRQLVSFTVQLRNPLRVRIKP